MNVKIEFHTDNAAFEYFAEEITRVIRSAKEALIDSDNTTTIRRPLKDSNGNRIGTVSIEN